MLHAYPYKETSLIVEAFTRQRGRVALLARGARRPRSAMRGMLLAFYPLRLTWSGSAELGNLVGVEWAGGMAALGGHALMCGFYLNELLLKLLPREDPHERLFDAYTESLARLAAGEDRASVLRGFERRLLAEVGYAPLLERDALSGAPIEPMRHYVYEPDRGPMPADGIAAHARSGDETVLSGRTLLDLARDDYGRPQTRAEARLLLRALIARRLGGQPLHTRTVLKELQDL